MSFSFLFHKKKGADAKSICHDRAYSYMEQLAAGQENCLAALYSELLSEDEAFINSVAEAIHAYMSRLDAPNIIKLDRQFRQYTSMEWSIDWEGLSTVDIVGCVRNPEVCLSVLRLGVLHPNGYFREKCMRALAGNEDSYGYIALRLNDWVKQVRDIAYTILSERLDSVETDTAIGMLPFVNRTKKGERYVSWQFQDIETKLAQKIWNHLDEISLDKIREYPPATKRFLYRILVLPEVLSKADAERLLEREKNGNEKALIISLILKKYECGEAEIEGYLKNKSPIVRKKALEMKYERLGDTWAGLEEFLLDTAKGIRGDVCYILRKHTDMDIPSFYKEKLHTDKEAVAILGIGENGSAKDADVLAEYLFSHRARLVKNAMKALSGLGVSRLRLPGNDAAGQEMSACVAVSLDAVYWDYLNGTDASIARAAYDAICKSNIFYGSQKLYQTYKDCLNDNTKKYLLYLLAREPSWERLPYLLLLYEPCLDSSDKTQMLVLRAIGFRSVYTRITKAQADFIMEILERPEVKIPDGIKKGILFDLKHIAVI